MLQQLMDTSERPAVMLRTMLARWGRMSDRWPADTDDFVR